MANCCFRQLFFRRSYSSETAGLPVATLACRRNRHLLRGILTPTINHVIITFLTPPPVPPTTGPKSHTIRNLVHTRSGWTRPKAQRIHSPIERSRRPHPKAQRICPDRKRSGSARPESHQPLPSPQPWTGPKGHTSVTWYTREAGVPGRRAKLLCQAESAADTPTHRVKLLCLAESAAECVISLFYSLLPLPQHALRQPVSPLQPVVQQDNSPWLHLLHHTLQNLLTRVVASVK